MDILSRGFSAQNTAAQSVQKGLGGITSSIGKGVQGVGNVVGIKQTDKETRPGEGDAQSHHEPDQDQAKSSIEPQPQGTGRSSSQHCDSMFLSLWLLKQIQDLCPVSQQPSLHPSNLVPPSPTTL
jgi:hypothetical protein